MSKNVVIWDCDHLAYLGNKDDTLPEILEKVDYKINEVFEETKADYYVLALSQGSYFRHKLTWKSTDKLYKGHRKHDSQPWVKTIKEYLKVKYGAFSWSGVEGDDVCAWLMSQKLGYVLEEPTFRIEPWEILESAKDYLENETDSPEKYTLKEINKILVATDKDLLQSIPGKHLNPVKKLDKDTWGLKWIETSDEDSWFYEWEAMVCGDSADGIQGIYRKGKAWCDKNFASKSLKEVQELVFSEYCKEYDDISKAIYEFQKNWRLLHILNCNDDFMREVQYIPELPVFQKVDREIKKENNEQIPIF